MLNLNIIKQPIIKLMPNIIQLIKLLSVRPKHGFLLIQQNHTSSWPIFIIIMLILQIFWMLYFSQVNMVWLLDFTLNTAMGDLTPAETAQFKSQLTPEILRYSSQIGSSLMLILQALLIAVYLNIVTKLDEENTDSLKDWFAFYWWVQIPLIFQLALAIIVMQITDASQLTLYDLQITSLNQILNLTPTDKLYSFAASFDLFSIWSIILMFYGLTIKTQLKTTSICNICLIPLAVTFGFSYIMN